MTALKTLAVAVGAFGVEVVAFVLIMTATLALIIPDSIRQGSYGVRLSGAVVAFILWSVPGGAAAFIAIRLSAHRIGANFLGAVFIVAAFNGLISYLFLAYTTLLNECIWHVSFPLGGSGECGFG